MIMANERGAEGLGENKCHSSVSVTPLFKKGRGGGPKELQDGQPHADPAKGDRATYPRNQFQAHEHKTSEK